MREGELSSRCSHTWSCGNTSQLQEGKPQRGLFSQQLWINGPKETQAAGYIILWIWAMMFYRIKLHTEAWELKKKVSLTFSVAFHSSLLVPCAGGPQTGYWCSLTSPALRTCENYLPRPAGCTLNSATQYVLLASVSTSFAVPCCRNSCPKQKLFFLLDHVAQGCQDWYYFIIGQVRNKGCFHLQKNYIHSYSKRRVFWGVAGVRKPWHLSEMKLCQSACGSQRFPSLLRDILPWPKPGQQKLCIKKKKTKSNRTRVTKGFGVGLLLWRMLQKLRHHFRSLGSVSHRDWKVWEQKHL